MEIANEKLLEMYRNLLTARKVDEKLFELYSAGGSGMPWLHRGTGEEAATIAVCANLRKDDYFHPGFRTLYCLFAKGLTLKDVFATECGRDATAQVGMHSSYMSVEYGLLGTAGSGGEDAPILFGAAVSAMLRKTGQVCVFIDGDGFANRGPVHEAMVMAGAAGWRKVPIVFMIQNNQYGMGTSVKNSYGIEDLSDRAKAYGFPGESVDGNDVIACYEVTKRYIDRARNGGGPSLVVANTYRLKAHFEGDMQIYRPKGEVEEWWKKDPLPRYQKKLMGMGILTEEDVSKLENEIRASIDKAAEEALAVPRRSYEDHTKTYIDEL